MLSVIRAGFYLFVCDLCLWQMASPHPHLLGHLARLHRERHG